MPIRDLLNDQFRTLLTEYPDGISSTSTKKYEAIKNTFAREFRIPAEGIYPTGTTSKRVSNLDTRYAQGNQRGQHAQLALAFLKIERGEGSGTRDARIKAFRERAWNTSRKFVTGEERGTTFDSIVLLVQFENERELVPAGMLARTGWPVAKDIASGLMLDESDIEYLEPMHVRSPTPTATAPQRDQAASTPAVSNLMVVAFETSLQLAGLQVPAGIVARVLAALLAKRFLILQGLSGSGKTGLALAVGKWFQEVDGQRDVAVGADWTSNEHVLGYQDALDSTKYRRPVSGALDVILAAKNDPTRPYFLILDEMNLSHVERYFSDMLSAIESQEPLALHATDEDVDRVPPEVFLPPNLFVIENC